MTTTEKYHALVAEATAHALPKAYDTDLHTHDRQAIEQHDPARFLWILRTNGTHLIIIDDLTEREARDARAYLKAIWNCHGDRKGTSPATSNGDALYYYFDGNKLHLRTYAQVYDLIKPTNKGTGHRSYLFN